MGRRYKRREFLTDAAVVAAGSILLKICAPNAQVLESGKADASSEQPSGTAQ